MIRDYPDAPLSRPLFYLCRQLIQAQRYEKYLTYANKNEKMPQIVAANRR